MLYEIFEFLFVLSLVLLIVAAVVFVIWMVVAAVFRAMLGSSRSSRRTYHCDHCGTDYLLALRQCPRCGTVEAGTAASPIQADLAATERQINRLFAAGLIGAEQQAEWLATFREQTGRLIEPAATEPVPSPPATGEPAALEIDEFLEAEPAVSPPAPTVPSSTEPAITQPAAVDVAKPSASPRRRAVADLLQAFMEEKNIRWGELVSGLLIVGSAVGLVISLWATLKDAIPYFPALLFMAATAAIHGAGLYTLRQWNLKSTSRGLLTISMLLVPLNLLAAVALSDQRPTTDTLYAFALAIGLTVFGWITVSGARILMRGRYLLTSIAVLGPAAAQLYIGRLCRPGLSDGRLALLAALPLLSYVIATSGPLWQLGSARRLSPRMAIDWLRLLGIAAFSLSVALGLMFWKTAAIRETVSALSPGLSLAAAAVLSMGLVIHQRLTATRLTEMRTVGTALAVFGSLLITASVVSAWPRPHLLIAVGLVDFLALTLLAIRANLPLLHVGAVTSLSLAGLVGFHLASGTIITARSLEQTLLMGRSGLVLTALGLLAGTAAWGMRRVGRNADGTSYLYSAVGLGSLAALIALYAGFFSGVDRNLTTPILWADAMILLTASARFRNQAAAWCGSVLLLVANLHALQWNTFVIDYLGSHGLMPDRSGVAAALAHATVIVLITLAGKRWAGWRAEGFIPSERRAAGTQRSDPANPTAGNGSRVATALCITAIISLGLSLPATVGISGGLFTTPALYTVWAAGVWLLLAAVLESAVLFGFAQTLGTVAVSFAVTGLCRDQIPWERIAPGSPFDFTPIEWLFGGHPHAGLAYFDPRHLHMQFCILACWSLLWIGLRRFAGRRSLLSRLARPDRPTVDRVLLAAVAIGTIGLAGWACLPGLHAELAAKAIRLSAVDTAEALMLSVFILLSIGTLVATGIAAGRRDAAGLVLLMLTGGAALALLVPKWTIASSLMAVHQHAWGPGGWLSLGIVVAVMVAALWERMSATALVGIVLTLVTVPLLIAARYQSAGVVTFVLQSGLALYGLAVAIVLSFRRPLCLLIAQTGRFIRGDKVAGPMRSCVLAASVVPILAWSLRTAFLFAGSAFPPLPDAELWLARLSPSWWYAGPPGILALTSLVYAVRERRPSFLSAASLMISLAVSLAYLLPIWSSGATTGLPELVRLLQWNAVALGGCGVGWLLIRRWTVPAELSATDAPPVVSVAFIIQVRLALIVVISLAVWAAVAIVRRPGILPASIAPIGHLLSYVAVALTMAASFGSAMRRKDSEPLHEIGLLIAATATFAAASNAVNNTAANWLSYHVLMIGWCVAAALFTTVAASVRFVAIPDPTGDAGFSMILRRISVRLCAAVDSLIAWMGMMGVLVILLAVRAEWSDPARPWWTMAATAVVAVLVTILGIMGRSQRAAYISTGLAVLATSFVWMMPWLGLGEQPSPQSWVQLVEADVIALASSGLFWLGVELWWQRKRLSVFDSGWASPPIQQTAGGVGLLAAGTLAVVCLTIRTLSETGAVIPDVSRFGGWMMLVTLGALLKGSLWDRTDRMGAAGLYALGLVAVTVLLDALELSQRNLWFAIGLTTAGYPVLTGLIWAKRRWWVSVGERLTMPAVTISPARIAHWLPATNLMLASVAVIIEMWVVLTFEDRTMRLYGSAAALLLGPGLALLAQDRRRAAWQFLALLALAVAAVDFGWALMPVGGARYFWLQRTIRLMVVLATTTFAYGVVVPRLLRPDHGWFAAVRQAATAVGGGALASLLVVLVMEGLWYVPGAGAPITAAQIAVVAVALVGLSAGLISLAVLPDRDPLSLSERGRTGYVYAAESVLALLFVHIYFTMPQLFTGMLLPYWPFIVMGIAFLGIGVGELFTRLRLNVLAEPLQQTGAFLPLLPAIGYWIHVMQAGPGVLRGDYSTLLMIVGVLYILVSLWRQSFVYGLAAALAGNGALWALLQEHGQTILIHPQMWMIPPALSVLAAAHWNRRQLGEAKLTAIRYLCVTIIYVSSTGEMFLTGAGESLALPMVLAGLSVAGVLAGILMRVRAFLYLGTSFLLLSIVSMVWHAARNIGHVWPWWVFGIVLGIAILTLFGLFEKRRQDMLALLDEMRRWER